MTTSNRTPTVELIPVQRRPHLKNKIPLLASAAPNDVSEQFREKWRGTTPQGRELIRKKLWTLERQMLAAKAEFEYHWGKIKSLFPKLMFTQALSIQDHDNCKYISEHLTRTEQWAAYRMSVERTAAAFEFIRGWPDYKDHSGKVEFLKRIVGEHTHDTESAMNSGSEKGNFTERSQFPS